LTAVHGKGLVPATADGTGGSAGFTLIELLVVLVLVGVIGTFAVVNLAPRTDPRLENEARRLAAVLELAAETAVLQGRELGLVIDREGYRLARLGDDGGWEMIGGGGDRVLRPQPLPEDMEVRWVADGLPGERTPGGSGDNGDGGREAQRNSPVILMLSSGELTPFQLTLGWRDTRQREGWLLEGSLTGNLTLTRAEVPVP